MTSKELKALLPDDETPIFIVAANIGYGDDTYSPLDHIHTGIDGKVLLGATEMLCGTDKPVPTSETMNY